MPGTTERPLPQPVVLRPASLSAAVDETLLVAAHLTHSAPLLGAIRAFPQRVRFARLEVAGWRVTLDGATLHVAVKARARRARRLLSRLFDMAEVEGGSGLPASTAMELREVDLRSAFRRAREGWIVIPDSVCWRGSVEAMPPDPLPKSLRTDLRAATRAGYEAEPGRSAADWRMFWDSMAVPYAHARFSDDAWFASRPLRVALQHLGALLFVRRNGRRVAGIALLASGRVCWAPVLGVHSGDPNEVRTGAITALYAAAIEWMRARNVTTADFGRTVAFADDGVAFYKRKWGFRPTLNSLTDCMALRADPAIVARIMARAPFYHIRDGALTLSGDLPP